ncbi:MAG TPA: tetratricopeptide repeat protein [Terracidiphilus sp.]|nr:tetratricopeptide repeat protein [Terracidiphilus sp.]
MGSAALKAPGEPLQATPVAAAQTDSGSPAESAAPALTPKATGTPPAPAASDQPQVVIPAVPPTPEELGDSLAMHQHYQGAIAAYAKVQPPTSAVWNKMGIAYQMMFNVKDATRCYNASLKLDPKNPQVLNNLATVYDSQKQYGNAERSYRKALKIEPKNAVIMRNLGSNLLAQHKYKKGTEAYRAALAINPQIMDSRSGASVQNPASVQDRGALHYYMAKGCVSAGNHECAIQNLRLALNEGFTNVKKIAGDGSFASLRDLPAFQQLIATQSAQ